ncbi:MAG: hypothetical protein JSU87_04360 [Gemmatimonadota bacterium]|nr:MAG: hypothetical protein JSU87_04360 [Gemmatimonadota bacterium]
MRRSGLTLALSLLLAGPLSAQVRSEVELTRQQIQTERQALVTAGMQLTEEQAQAFWPVYREYRNELAPLGDRMVELILGYAEQYGSVTDEYAGKMLAEYLDIQKKQLDIRNKYVSQFGKVLPPMLVARFYQIENKLDAVVAYDLAMSIPVLQ